MQYFKAASRLDTCLGRYSLLAPYFSRERLYSLQGHRETLDPPSAQAQLTKNSCYNPAERVVGQGEVREVTHRIHCLGINTSPSFCPKFSHRVNFTLQCHEVYERLMKYFGKWALPTLRSRKRRCVGTHMATVQNFMLIM